jgi:hypothetical protein
VKKRLNISFSGGRTSAVMTKLCFERYSDEFDIIVTFANTGCEHEATLDFINDCDKNWGFNTVWLEAVVNMKQGVGIRAKVVDYETASRNGEPFEASIQKYGVPNTTHPNCTGRLKEEVIYAYLRDYAGWPGKSYYQAIGIRADEYDRMSSKAEERRLIYPLVKLGFTKEMVKQYMAESPFDLKLPGDHYGNCVTCWKKSFRKLMTIAKNEPHYFDFFKRMEEQYGDVKNKDGFNKRVFFRTGKDTNWLLNESNVQEFNEYSDEEVDMSAPLDFDNLAEWEFWDKESGCGSSCEIGADD